MKGLLLKELIMFRKSCFSIIILIGTFTLIGIFSGEPQMLLIVSLFMSIWSFSFLNMDEVSRWKQYSIALPYGRKKIVSSKYLMMLILDAFSIVLISICYLISVVIGKTGFSVDFMLMLIFLSVIMGLVYPIIILPLNYKFNTEKSRLILMIINGAMGAISVMVMQSSIISVNTLNDIAEYIPLIVLVAVALLFVGSWALSVKIYEKKDL